ncbi:MAG TPA: AraC family transcriptional regulator [Nannocystis exedens]|nr:AraC family transcriptional regulator [Nannocystis exedens]
MDDSDRTLHAHKIQPGMAGSIVANTVLFAVAHGVTMERITAATGVTIADVIEPDARLPSSIVPAIWNLLSAVHPGRALTLEMAAVTPFSFFGAFAYGVHYAADLREIFATFVRFRSILSDQLEAVLVESPQEVALRFHHPMDLIDHGAGAEVAMALSVRLLREIVGTPDLLKRVEFSHSQRAPIGAYDAFFSVPVRFNSAANAFVLEPAALDKKNPAKHNHNKELFALIQARLDLVRKRLVVNDRLSEVRQAIAENAKRSDYTAQSAAKRVGMSLRALQRYTAEHGTTVRRLLDEARRANACELLGDRQLSVEEVGFLVGYSDERAFRRSFERMTGQTPARFRRALG